MFVCLSFKGDKDQLTKNPADCQHVGLNAFFSNTEIIEYKGTHQVPNDKQIFAKLNDHLSEILKK